MGVYSVPVTIGVDEKAIAERIENEVCEKVTANIKAEVANFMYEKTWGHTLIDKHKPEFKEVIKEEIRKTVKEHEDLIIMQAVSDLVTRLANRKRVIDLLEEISNKMNKE